MIDPEKITLNTSKLIESERCESKSNGVLRVARLTSLTIKKKYRARSEFFARN